MFCVAVASIKAVGNEGISTSGLSNLLLIAVKRIASSTLSFALFRIWLNWGFVRSSIFRSSFFTCSVVSLRNGYLARSVFVNRVVAFCILVFHMVIRFRFLVRGRM